MEYKTKGAARGGMVEPWERLRALRKIYHQRSGSGGSARRSVTPELGVFNKSATPTSGEMKRDRKMEVDMKVLSGRKGLNIKRKLTGKGAPQNFLSRNLQQLIFLPSG